MRSGGTWTLGDTQIDVRLNDIHDRTRTATEPRVARGKEQPGKPAGTTRATSKSEPGKPIDVPNIKGKLTDNILGGKVSGGALPAPVLIDPGSIVGNIPDINQPIQNDIKLAYHVEGSQPEHDRRGRVGGCGGERQGRSRELKESVLKATQKITLGNVDTRRRRAVPETGAGRGRERPGQRQPRRRDAGLFRRQRRRADRRDQCAVCRRGIKDQLALDRINYSRSGDDERRVIASTMLIMIEKLAVETPLANVNVAGEVPQQALEKLGKQQPRRGRADSHRM
jgi:hypothetical protein